MIIKLYIYADISKTKFIYTISLLYISISQELTLIRRKLSSIRSNKIPSSTHPFHR